MEYIHGETLEELIAKSTIGQLQECYHQITRAIKLFLSIEIPTGVNIGPVNGGIIKHPLFKDAVASIQYAPVNELQLHANKVATNFLLL
jgi:hypothetical protein